MRATLGEHLSFYYMLLICGCILRRVGAFRVCLIPSLKTKNKPPLPAPISLPVPASSPQKTESQPSPAEA